MKDLEEYIVGPYWYNDYENSTVNDNRCFKEWNDLFHDYYKVRFADAQPYFEYFASILQWCVIHCVHDWNAFNGSLLAFENEEDAMCFKLIWG